MNNVDLVSVLGFTQAKLPSHGIAAPDGAAHHTTEQHSTLRQVQPQHAIAGLSSLLSSKNSSQPSAEPLPWLSLQPVKAIIDADNIAYQRDHQCTRPPKLSSKQTPAKVIVDAKASINTVARKS